MEPFAALFGYALGVCVGIFVAALLLGGGGQHIRCITDGATLLHKSTQHQKYLIYYCVKNGKVVP